MPLLESKEESEVSLDSLDELRYADVVMKRYREVMIRPNRPTYLYDPVDSKFYRMRTVFPSFCSYDGGSELLQVLRNENEDYYVLAPMYGTNLVKNESQTFKSESGSVKKSKPRLVPSLKNSRHCNAGDIQPLVGGKLKIGEDSFDGIIREIEEETCLRVKRDDIVKHSTFKNDRGCTTFCFSSPIVGADGIKVEDKVEVSEEAPKPRDDVKRKVCISLYGTAEEIAQKLNNLQDVELDDNIIGLTILPIEVAIQIDDNSVQYWKKRNEKLRRSAVMDRTSIACARGNRSYQGRNRNS